MSSVRNFAFLVAFNLYCNLFVITEIKCQKSNFKCNVTQMDECSANFFLLCNNTVKYPETIEEQQLWCRYKRPEFDKCLKDYAIKCVNTVLRHALTLMRRSLNTYHVSVCSSHVNTDRRLSLTKCWNSVKPQFLTSCHFIFNDHMIEIKKMSVNKHKLPSLCCHYWNFISCGTKLIWSAAKEKVTTVCDSDHAIEFDSFNKNAGLQFFGHICGDKYKPDSIPCDELILSQKRVEHPEQHFKWRSAIPYWLDVFNSL